MTDPATGCLICGSDLVYGDKDRKAPCSLCGAQFSSQVACAAGHYVCDRCHELPAFDLIEQTCRSSNETDPVKLAEALMRSPVINMHGPEHHYLVPAVLITAYCSLKNDSTKIDKLAIARNRAMDVKGGFCGFHGTCGAAMGAGIACSILTRATPLSKDEWRLSNLITGTCLTAIGEAGGPRCCKRDTYLTLVVSRDFLNRHLMAGFPDSDFPICRFAAGNKECLAENCRFFPAPDLPKQLPPNCRRN